MWLFPWLTLLIIVFIIGIFAVMAIFPIQGVELLSMFDLTAFLVTVGAFLQKSEGGQSALSARRSAMQVGHTLYGPENVEEMIT
ncbi:L-asparagine transporter-like permease [Pseudomonas sp. 2725]|uniref:hypothetical protein n=1 Tax=Pseudomonas sp. 2725 TaxID=3156449 RepID=UPI003D23CE8F